MTRFSQPMIVAFVLAIIGLLHGCSHPTAQRFVTANEAVDSFVVALRDGDRTRLEEILGSDADDVLYSGDDVADQQAMSDFIASYDARHQLVGESDDSYTLVVGENEWPMPVPLVTDAEGGWYFDVAAGRDELLNRRIGRNELSTMQACLAIVDAQHEYAGRDPDGNGRNDFAAKFLSDPGDKNGLFWPTNAGEAPSPLGDLVSRAAEEGYSRPPRGELQPYQGYYFRMLTKRGAHAPGGEGNYVVDGALTDGFGVIAWPAEYGNSGIATFIISHDGLLYEQDFGPDTDGIARNINEFDPDPSWTLSDLKTLTALSWE